MHEIDPPKSETLTFRSIVDQVATAVIRKCITEPLAAHILEIEQDRERLVNHNND